MFRSLCYVLSVRGLFRLFIPALGSVVLCSYGCSALFVCLAELFWIESMLLDLHELS